MDGDLRVADELGGGGARLRQCDPDASAGADLEPGDGEGAAQGVMQRVGNVARLHVGAGAELAQQDEERVAGEPGDHPLRTNRVAQSDGDRGEQLVPRLVAERVVDELEVVEVEAQRGHGARPAVLQQLCEVRLGPRPVRQAGQRIVQRRVPRARLGLTELSCGRRVEPGGGLGRKRGEQAQALGRRRQRPFGVGRA